MSRNFGGCNDEYDRLIYVFNMMKLDDDYYLIVNDLNRHCFSKCSRNFGGRDVKVLLHNSKYTNKKCIDQNASGSAPHLQSPLLLLYYNIVFSPSCSLSRTCRAIGSQAFAMLRGCRRACAKPRRITEVLPTIM